MQFGGDELKNRVCLVIPFFGQLPQSSELFFKSLSKNPSLNVLLITDSDIDISLENVTVFQCTFTQLVHRVQSFFDFQIVLDKPYKLCDFRPAYGVIFHDLLQNYDFWGYCDLDLVLGNFNDFVNDSILDIYDKIYQHGHLSLYRNCKRVNYEFKSPYGMDYRKVFSTSINCVFDELEGIQKKFDHDGFKTYKKWDFFDVNPWRYHLTRVTSYVPQNVLRNSFDFTHECFEWNQGHVYRLALYDNHVVRNEYIYIHFQKRNYKVFNGINNYDGILCLSNNECIKCTEEIKREDFDKYNKFSYIGQSELTLRKLIFTWKRRFKKYILRKG